jgi:hypothetical protein
MTRFEEHHRKRRQLGSYQHFQAARRAGWFLQFCSCRLRRAYDSGIAGRTLSIPPPWPCIDKIFAVIVLIDVQNPVAKTSNHRVRSHPQFRFQFRDLFNTSTANRLIDKNGETIVPFDVSFLAAGTSIFSFTKY